MQRSTTSAKRRGRPSGTANGRRTCSKCGRRMLVDMFAWSKPRNSWNSWCRECVAEYGRRWRKRKKGAGR